MCINSFVNVNGCYFRVHEDRGKDLRPEAEQTNNVTNSSTLFIKSFFIIFTKLLKNSLLLTFFIP